MEGIPSIFNSRVFAKESESMQTESVELDQIAIQPVEPHSPVPLYHQVEQDLRRLIRSQQLPVGSLLPPEIVLSGAYGVGRQTMRMAIARLVDDGLVSRRAGKGTVIQSQRDRRQFYLDRSFTQQMREIGLTARSKVLETRNGLIDDQSVPALARYRGEPCFYLARVRYGNEEPMGIQQTTIREKLCPLIHTIDFSTKSLYSIIAQEYHLLIREIFHTVNAVGANEWQAGLLKVKTGTPLVQVNTRAFVAEQQIIECTMSVYRSDRYEFSTREAYLDCR